MNRATTALKAAREEMGLTQEELEESSGVSQATISDLEKRGPNAAVRKWFRLSRALGKTMDELVAADIEAADAEARASTRVRVRPRELKDTTAPRRSRAA